MTVMRMKESKFGAPIGVYSATFLGCQPMKDDGQPRIGNDGKPMEPGLEWQWEITEGPHKGQIVGRITSQSPTTRNMCGRLLNGLMGRAVQPEEGVDLDQFRGTPCQVVIGPHSKDPEKTYVTQVMRARGSAPGASPSPAPIQAVADRLTERANERAEARAGSPPRPPSAPPAPPAPPAASRDELEAKYWVSWHGDTLEMTGAQIHEELLKQPGLDPSKLPVMAHDQKGGWQTAAAFGLHLPF